jgi:hypothetical protein
MKNFFRWLSLIALVATIGFGFIACDDGGSSGDSNPFIGTWTDSVSGLTITFTSNTNWVMTYDGDTFSGTYTYSGNNATLYEPGEPSFTAVIAGNNLTLILEDGTSLTLTRGGHTHTYSSTWSSNATQHWHECTAGDGATSNVGNHSGNPCTVCGYSSGGGGNATWTEVANSTFDTSGIQDIAYADGKFVAVGSSGKMATSPDGKTWTPVTNSTFGTSNGIGTIIYGGGKFVAGGSSGKMAYSSDGVNWTAADSTFNSINYDSPRVHGIAYGNGKYVAVGSQGQIATSSDCATWTKVTNTFTRSDDVRAIAFGNGKFVAGGDYGKMATSTDGVNWTAVENSTFDNYLYEIIYANNKFVAGARISSMAYSPDGVSWTALPSSNANEIFAWGNNKFVAMGGSNWMYSSDGVTWTSGPRFADKYTFFAIAYGDGKFVIGDSNGKMLYSTGL